VRRQRRLVDVSIRAPGTFPARLSELAGAHDFENVSIRAPGTFPARLVGGGGICSTISGFNPRAGNVPGATASVEVTNEGRGCFNPRAGNVPGATPRAIGRAQLHLFQSARRERSRRDLPAA